MAEYLIQDTTLDAIADAINAKTGGSSAMTPAEMVTNIAAIPTGGGGGGATLLADYTASEDVSAINITFPSNVSEYDVIVFEAVGNYVPNGHSSYTPYALFNNDTRYRTYLNNFVPQSGDTRMYTWLLVKREGQLYQMIGGINPRNNSPYTSTQFTAYKPMDVFATGFNVKMWGYKK